MSEVYGLTSLIAVRRPALIALTAATGETFSTRDSVPAASPAATTSDRPSARLSCLPWCALRRGQSTAVSLAVVPRLHP
jgi:hypothetical protein